MLLFNNTPSCLCRITIANQAPAIPPATKMDVNVRDAHLAHKQTPSLYSVRAGRLHLLVMRHRSWCVRAAPPCTWAATWKPELPHVGQCTDPARPERPQAPQTTSARAAARRLPSARAPWLKQPAHRTPRSILAHASLPRPERCPRRNPLLLRSVRAASIKSRRTPLQALQPQAACPGAA